MKPTIRLNQLSGRQHLTTVIILGSLAAMALAEGPNYSWLNQKDGPRPRYVWENREDVIYHDLSYSDKAVERAPEFAAFMGRTWVFNPGKQVGPIPPNITLDTTERTAHWYGVFESETISLD